MSADDDRRVVRRAALRVGTLVAGASAVAIAVGVGVLVSVLVAQARTEGSGRHGPGGAPTGDRFVVDLDDVLPWVIGHRDDRCGSLPHHRTPRRPEHSATPQ
ncbi:hypothetical protein [Microbacterium testaceum]|uniref:hypothetical protein n=1 Tax=Microbacterium testaceum TaxID=2033 RepID=UPI002AC7DE57|nr:hypothetical protein [Microbacterium testaceum]MDZ5142964.1 hypothetical protein [Microbacterium testaceum]